MKKPRTYQAQKTQTEILSAALKLFNNRSATQVTTHDIANEAGISPGNLYYHYKNKEEIIRALFWRMELFSKLRWQDRGPWNPKEGMTDFMRFFFGELDRYRFFFREFGVLLCNDSALAKLWHIRYESLFEAMRSTAELWVKAGILKPFKSSDDVDSFIENFWVLANFSGVHIENRKKSQSSKEALIHYLYPYHTHKGQRVLDFYLA